MSTSPKHTPGPWRHETIKVKEFDQMGVRRQMFGADGQLMLWQEPHFKNPFDRLYDVVRLSDADWPLIGAAPQMLEALKYVAVIAHEGGLIGLSEADAIIAIRKLSARWSNLSKSKSESIEALTNAIAKAEGGQP